MPGAGHWEGALAPARPHLILTHDEEKSRTALAGLLQQRDSVEATLPYQGQAQLL